MENKQQKVKQIFAERGLGFYLAVPAIVFAVLALVWYRGNGVTEFSPQLNSSAVACLIVGMALCVLSMAADVVPGRWVSAAAKPVRYAAYLVELYAFLMFLYSQVTYIANVFVSIDGNSFTAGFIATAVFFVLAAAFTLVSAALNACRPWQKAKKEQMLGEVQDEK